MRVTGGILSGRTILVPKAGVRPTQDRVRESLFSSLAPRIPGARVLDLYAGSGALGIEAWSRGAAEVVWVERDRRVFDILRRNVETLCRDGGATVCRCADAERFVRRRPEGTEPFDLILADPPYRDGETPGRLENSLRAIRDASILAPGGLFVYEQGGREETIFPGWRRVDCKRFGRTSVIVFSPDETPRGERAT